MSELNRDGNILGRIGAVALLVAAGLGLHRLNCATGEMRAVMKTDLCYVGAKGKAKAPSQKAAPLKVVPVKVAPAEVLVFPTE